jgi:hypothetical protein
MTMVSGCQSAEKAVPATKTEQAKAAAEPAKNIANPITITPGVSSPGSKVDAKGGISKQEAQIAGARYLVALRKARLGDRFGATSEEYTLLNQVEMRGEWLLTYSRTTVATIFIDAKSGKQRRVTEAP